MQVSFPETVLEFLWFCKLFASCPGGWFQAIWWVKKPDVAVPLDWRSYTWTAIVRPVDCMSEFLETTRRWAYGGEIKIHLTGMVW